MSQLVDVIFYCWNNIYFLYNHISFCHLLYISKINCIANCVYSYILGCFFLLFLCTYRVYVYNRQHKRIGMHSPILSPHTHVLHVSRFIFSVFLSLYFNSLFCFLQRYTFFVITLFDFVFIFFFL